MLNAFALAGVALVIGAMLPAQAQTALPPIGSVGHGSILGANGKDVAPTRALILASQKYYIDRLLSQLPGDRQTQLLGQRARMSSGRAVVEEDEVYANSIFIEKLISVAKPADALAMDSINSVIVNQYAKMVRPPGSVAAVSGIALAPSAIMQAAVDSEGLKKKQQDSEGLSGQAYIDACAAAGVPVPPPWGDKRWKSNGRLQTKFILETEVAEVFWYQSKSPVGVCIALPRWKENDKKNVNVGALGIICQGHTTGTSCYWDNMKKKEAGRHSNCVAEGCNGPADDIWRRR